MESGQRGGASGGARPGRPVPASSSAFPTHATPGFGDRRPAAFTGGRLRRYQVLGELGRGGMGVVYRALDPELGREVALKVLTPRAGSDRGGDVRWQRFRLEAEALARLRHPHVVQVHEVGEEGGVAFLVMALVEGQSLADRVRERGPLPPREAARIAAALAGALDALHAQGVLHRDVKPANVVLSADDRPILMDFGLARVAETSIEDLTATGQFVGTPCYMPPEQAAGSPGVDRRVDVYSLGATLFELLTGRPPFEADSLVELLCAIQDVPAPRASSARAGVGRDLDAICGRCLAKAPEDRYASAAELARDLLAYLDGLPLEIAAPSLGARAWRGSTWQLGLTTALVVAAGLWGAALLTRPGSAPESASPSAGSSPPATELSVAAPPRRTPPAGPVPAVVQRAIELARTKAGGGPGAAADQAIEQYEFALQCLAPEHPLGATVKGELAPLLAARAAAHALAAPERAVADASRAFALAPASPLDPVVLDAYRVLAGQAYARGDFGEARSLFDQAAAIGPSDGVFHDRGTLRQERGDLEGGFTDYGRALELNPSRVVLYEQDGPFGDGQHVRLARSLLARGRRPGAGGAALTEPERSALQAFLSAVERARALHR